MPTDIFNQRDFKKKSWRERAKTKREPFNPEYEIKKEAYPSPTDQVIKHPGNGANIRIKDNGTIQLFSNNNTGIKIDPNSGAIQFFGNKFKSMTDEFHINSDDNKFLWNYMPFNSELTDPFREVVTAKTVPNSDDVSGTNTLKNILSNNGAYISSSPGSPATAGNARNIDSNAVDLKGISAYKGTKTLNQMKATKEGISEILKEFSSIR